MAMPTEATTVRLRITCDIDDVDETKGTFLAEGWITFECGAPPNIPNGPLARNDPVIMDGNLVPFMPTSLFKNSTDLVESDSTYEVKDQILRGYIGYKATISMSLNYKFMPMDKHVLALQLQPNPAFIKAWLDVQYDHLPVRIAVDPHEWFWNHEDGNDPNDASFFGLSESLAGLWYLRSPRLNKDNPDFLMPIARNPFFLVINAIFPLFCVTSLAAAAFAFDIEDLNSRLTVVLTLVLSTIALRFSIAGSLPKIDHLTLLDIYILVSIMLLASIAAEMSLIYHIASSKISGDLSNSLSNTTSIWSNTSETIKAPLNKIDRDFFFAVSAIWIVTNILLCVAPKFPGILSESWDDLWTKYQQQKKNSVSRYARIQFE